jgi:glycerophosphoryl diester phosphodiesterase
MMKRTIAFFLSVLFLFSICSCVLNKESNTINFDKKSTKIIAHRGLSGLEIENTEEAFIAAGERSYYGIEADVRRTIDGKFIICHDKTLKRISEENINVEEATLEELLKVTLSIEDRNVEGRLCELSTYISICKLFDKHAFLELKSDFDEQEIGQIIDIVRSHAYVYNTTFISFNYTNLEYVRKYLPNQSVQYLFSKIDEDVIERLINDKIDVAISYKILTEEYLTIFHNAGLTVNCWTVDDTEIAENLASLGVDYITTNILE